MKTRASALIAGIALATTLSGCSTDSTDEPATDSGKALTVEVADMAYTPSSTTISAGQTVTWVFDDRGTPHDVVGLGDAKPVLRSPLLTSGTWEFTFTEPGTYNYTCSLHPDMLGVVVVI
ncbi:copper-binding protein [Prescottella agglutinans]|uniref:Copper-binding protein n=1 Tax=Prescottella agglutinans TaxID=1644129 RepID=A0A438BKR9_9NOCA|nr:plastocyanin/azurin family copper-binding protein [Prescottella agglutinans]RVW11553.1 copper-binding protein [Prescottella agglutinans]